MIGYCIGVKIIKVLRSEERNGVPGYVVEYEDGYKSWSPKDVLEKFYYQMGEKLTNSVTEQMVSGFFSKLYPTRLDEKTVLVSSELITGFLDHQTSACVDPNNFNMEIGTQICVNRTKNKIWEYLGFLLQWGLYGLKKGKTD